MNLTRVFFLAAAILFFVAAVGFTVVPNAMIWALFCIALGLFLNGYDFSFKKK